VVLFVAMLLSVVGTKTSSRHNQQQASPNRFFCCWFVCLVYSIGCFMRCSQCEPSFFRSGMMTIYSLASYNLLVKQRRKSARSLFWLLLYIETRITRSSLCRDFAANTFRILLLVRIVSALRCHPPPCPAHGPLAGGTFWCCASAPPKFPERAVA
jgi:hypothetical protein